MVGPLVTRTLAPMRLAVAIIGVDGVDVEAGLSTHDRDEAAANAAMVAAAKTVVVAADGSKLGRVFGAHIAATSAVHDIVTDDSADPQMVQCLQAIVT